MQSAIQQDYRQFYAQEILHRKAAQFPPYAQFIRFLFRGPHEAVQKACLDSVATLSAYFENHAVTPLQFDYGSAPIAKIKGESRMQILIFNLPQLKNGLVEKMYRLYFLTAVILKTAP